IYRQLGVATLLMMALRRGQSLIGFQTAAYRLRTQLGRPQQRIARGLAHLASLALEGSRLLEEAQSASRLKSEFVSTISHELRTPLNIILGYTDFLLEGDMGPLNTEQIDALHHVAKSGRDLLELISFSLDINRLEAGRLPLDLGKVDVANLMAEL